MSFTLVGNQDFVDNGGSTGLSFLSQEVAVGDLIIISVRYEGGGSSDASTVSATDTAGNTYNVIASQTAGEGQRIHLLYAVSQSAEALNAVTVTFSSSRSWRRANYTVFSSTSTPALASSVQDFSVGNTLTWDAGTLTGVKTDDMVIGWFGYYNTSGAGSEAAGFTEVDNHTLGVLEYKIATSDGSQDVTATPDQADSFAGIGALFTFDDGGGVSASVSESSQSFSDAISTTLTGNISASISGDAPLFSSSSSATVTGNISADVTEIAGSFSSNINASATSPEVGVNASINELSAPFADSLLSVITGNISATLTESAGAFSSSINADITFTKLAQVSEVNSAFGDAITANLAIHIDGSIIESSAAFGDVIRVKTPSKWVEVFPSENTWVTNTVTTNSWVKIT